MALQKPYSISIAGSVFDATIDKLVTWSTSGDITTAFQVFIYKNSDSSLVYDSTKITSYATQHTIPASTLTNGIEYKIKIQTWNVSADTVTSDLFIFETSSTPVVTLTPVGTVGGSSYKFEATYSQTELIALKYWYAYLYNSNQVLIGQSGQQTPTTIEYLFSGLETDKSYYVKFDVVSDKNLIGTTGLVSFNVLYSQPIMQSQITAENYDNASIKLQWLVKQIIGKGENYTYLENEKVNVASGKVWFDDGFDINNNFTLKIWIEGLLKTEVSETTEIIVYKLPPVNVNALWIEDATQATELILTPVISDSVSDVNTLWIVDDTQNPSISLSTAIDTTEPETINNLWVIESNPIDNLHILKLEGDNGDITLEYHDSTFYLYEIIDDVKTLVSSIAVNIYSTEDIIDDTKILDDTDTFDENYDAELFFMDYLFGIHSSSFYAYIQQINGVLSLHIEAIS